jgi:hypothetical protein
VIEGKEPTPMAAVDATAMERELRSLSWATGGWATLHAVGGLVLIVTGELAELPSLGLRLLVFLAIAAWTTAAIASWLFRRSLRARTGLIAAAASIVAGVVMGLIAFGDLAGTADSIVHLAAGAGMARALRQARPFLYLT